ncbi:MAG TPA: ATP-binding protein, partial [Albitalea sp.]|nr:ATP-binding protein [Albitalea sp.]
TPAWQVQRARRLSDGAPVLVKLVQPENPTPAQRARFRDEYELLRTLDVPGVVKPLALVGDQSRPAMVLEDFAGRSLQALLDAGKLNLQTGLDIANALARTLAGLHAAGVVHHDVRPTNILVATQEAAVCLVDCRLATRGAQPAPPAVPGDAIEGDWAYLAPEQTGLVNRAIDERADLYALGVTLYRFFGGELPLHADDPLGWAHGHVARSPRRLHELAPGLPSTLGDLVMRLLAKMPEDRYQSARGLHVDLKQCLAQWTRHGEITPFALGSHDVCERLRFPQNLYGRERELATLRAAFDRVLSSGQPELVRVSGAAGIGKSSLVHELRPSVVAAHGSFISTAPIPSERDTGLRELVDAVADEPQPLVLFIDELPGADTVGLIQIEELVARAARRCMLVVVACRDDSRATLRDAGLRAANLSDIVLGPLSREDLSALIAGMLHCHPDDAGALADVVHEKAAGHPAAAVQYLAALHRESLIAFDGASGAWRWDIELIRGKHLHEQAIQLAHTHGLAQNEALAHELAARFCREHGLAASADVHRREARDCYARAGNVAKTRELEAQGAAIAAAPAANGARQLDTRAVLQAAQAISSDILLDSLLKTLLSTVVEHAGAQKGLLYLVRDDALVLTAEAHVEGGQLQASLQSAGNVSSAPASILEFVQERRQAVVLGDAGAAHAFSVDSWLKQPAPKSVLCLPMLYRGELSGLLYLENNLVDQAFTQERLAVLELLASQAAISLENAQLYADLKLENWQAEADLLEREAHVRRLVDSNIIGVFFWSLNGDILDANDAFLQITGYTRADLEEGAIDWPALTPPEYEAADRNALRELRQSGTASQYEKEYITRDGQRVPVLIGAALLEDSRDMGIAFVLDLTERKRAAAELQARQAADAANEAKSQFLANMSHELRTPLNAILGYAQLLLNDKGRDERSIAGLETIRQSGELLLTLINDILDVAAIESGKMVLCPEPVDLLAFLNAVTDIVRVKADQKNLLLTLHTAAGLAPVVHVDEKRLRQVLLNLLSNAVKFTSSGEVQLRVYPLGPAGATVRLRFEVKDSGIGIGSEQLGTIFEPFVQAPDVQRRFGGTGLGLSISRQLLGLMGSEIHVDSRVREGSCFRFDLELPVERDATRVAPAAPRRVVTGYVGARRRLLVVDDIAANRMPLLDLLIPLGFEVFAADNGQAAVNLAQTLLPDLI